MSGRLFIRPFAYIGVILVLLAVGFGLETDIYGIYWFAVALGGAIAAFGDIQFIVLLAFGIVALRWMDVLLIAVIGASIRSGIMVSSLSEFHAEIGLRPPTFSQFFPASFLAFVIALSSLAVLYSAIKILTRRDK